MSEDACGSGGRERSRSQAPYDHPQPDGSESGMTEIGFFIWLLTSTADGYCMPPRQAEDLIRSVLSALQGHDGLAADQAGGG